MARPIFMSAGRRSQTFGALRPDTPAVPVAPANGGGSGLLSVVRGTLFIVCVAAASWFATPKVAALVMDRHTVSAHFSICSRNRVNCVVDGDTLWVAGTKIRVADIDTPELSKPRCGREKELAHQATRRFLSLLNEGPIEIERYGLRNSDKYGRLLRTVKRNGQSLGDILVAEGLAHRWIGYKQSWCG